MASSIRRHLALLFRCVSSLMIAEGANWAQLAGERAQSTATPYIPDQWHRDTSTSVRPMWSARWGHAVVVLNQSTPRSYLTEKENSMRLLDTNPVLLLLGGDDGLPRDTKNATFASEMGIGSGKLRNDVWRGQLTPRSQSPWRIDDRYFMDGGSFNPELIRSKMRWRETTPGRVAPATWSSGPRYSDPLTYDEWIACQDSIKDRLDYTAVLPDPSVCDDPPQFCYDDVNANGCHEQAIWKKDNMWSPRRGLAAAVVANDKIFVIGGQAREYARIEDSRLVGGLGGQHRIETVKEHSTIREDLVMKNDIWSSSDGGTTWDLVNPGCKDPQEDVLMQTEVWSRNHSDPTLSKNVGSMGSKCYRSEDCYGVAECKALGNTHEKVCVCPMFSPRMHHAIAVQHRFSVQENNTVIAEDVIYVVGGFTSAKQSFCASRSCGPADGYKLAMDDAWMSTDGINWTQIKPAFAKDSSFRGRGSHTALVVPSYSSDTENATEAEAKDRLLIFGGETSHPQELSTEYLNDVWQVDLPRAPCCIPPRCTDSKNVQNKECLPRHSNWNVITSNAKWSGRSGHTSVYEPPSPGNSFRHRVHLSGGKNAATVLSDVWTWDLESADSWQRDFPLDMSLENATSVHDAFLSIDSPLAEVETFQLPPLDNEGNLFNFTNHSAFPVVSANDISVMASEGLHTIRDLSTADLYSVLKLRGFDYPGRFAREVPNVCYLRAISIAIVDKCSLKALPKSFFHKKTARRIGQSLSQPPPTLCGRGGESKPCVRGDWDGCTPIHGVSKVDVHGLGDVVVPQDVPSPSSVMEEIFCRQVPGGRYFGAAEFLDSKLVLLGGIGDKATHLYRDVWTRDENFPQAFISTKPLTRTPQSQFYFASNEAGAHVFEYKLMRDGVGITPWTTTTKNLGADVSWLDDKKGGPGRGWYSIYVRAVDPSGNRDNLFSTQTNVYRWYYTPPIPWGAVSAYVITSLVLIGAGYFEYRRRKRKATLQRFQLRRLRRKFKLRSSHHEAHKGGLQDNIPPVIKADSSMHRRRSDAMEHSRSHMSRGSHEHSRSHRSNRRRMRDRGDRSHSRSRRSRGSNEHSRSQKNRVGGSHGHSRSHSRSHRSHSRSRSKGSKPSRSRSHGGAPHSGLRERRRKRRTAEDRAEDERRNRLRRDRELLRRQANAQG